MAAIVKGHLDWGLQRSPEGHRDIGITWLVRTTSYDDGPITVLNCPDLPQVGQPFAVGNDSDPWAFCHPDWTIQCVIRGEPNIYWTVSQTFSTRPLKRCQDTQIENPLLEPPQLGGSFVKYVKEARRDRFGSTRYMSSLELIRGAQMEFDNGKPTVTVSINDAFLGLETFSSMQDHVNDSNLWGLDPRMIKLSNTTWQRKLYGVCSYYFTRTHEFDIDFKTFDRKIPDFGSRVLLGWCPGSDRRKNPLDPEAPDPDIGGLPARLNVANFELYRDENGDIIDEIPLDGSGRPALYPPDAVDGLGDPMPRRQAEWTVEYYEEANFLELGVPISLEF